MIKDDGGFPRKNTRTLDTQHGFPYVEWSMSITIIIRIGIENQHLVNQRRLQLRVGLVQAVIDIFVVFEVFFFYFG